MARTFSGKAFNRPVDPARQFSRELGDELVAMASNTDPIVRASGANLECEWRVSDKRESEFHEMFDTCVPDLDEPTTIAGKLGVYFSDRIRAQTVPHFHSRNNADNLDHDLAPDTWLVNVHKVRLDPALLAPALNVARSILNDASDCLSELEKVFPRSTGASLFTLGATSDAGRQGFVERLFHVSGKPKWHPVWAGLWSHQFESIAGMGPDAWLAALGVVNKSGTLCLLFRYRLEDLRVFRPTYLDAGGYAEHFPSPSPDARWTGGGASPHGGHPMSLSAQTDVDPILEEFIHKDFVRKPEMVYAWGWTSAVPVTKVLEASRSAHYSRLGRYYTDLEKWLAEPT